ncbi:MAG: efflux RND transporter periplasmic adaptor subunit [Candidatus Caenarcaniphilales bacterium]|nr:efflux RND transporter periplasmic adaptor subunit [Candidatus Caenarcaniphilales bacterium]
MFLSLAISLILISFICSCSKKNKEAVEVVNNTVILSENDFLKVKNDELLNSIQSTGELEALKESKVNSEVTGNILKILVDEGQKVSKGQILAIIDSKDLQDQLIQSKEEQRKALAQKELARITLERKKIAFNEDLISKQELDTNETEFKVSQRDLESANARLSISQANLQRAIVKSPINGTISLKSISTGELAQIGKELFGIVQTNPLKIKLAVPNQYATEVKIGQKILASLSAIPEQKFEGKISRINPVADQATGTIEVSAEIDNSAEKLKIGLLANCQILLSNPRFAIVLPREALIKDGQNSFVYLLAEDQETLIRKELTVKPIDKDNTKLEVINGLAEGQTIVAIPLERNEERLKLKITK